jgi:septal ring factor EnvC (AmiA/AmiB activator)
MSRKMAKKKASLGSQLASARWAAATSKEKAEAARHRAQARWARWRAENGQPPKPGDEKFVDISKPKRAR